METPPVGVVELAPDLWQLVLPLQERSSTQVLLHRRDAAIAAQARDGTLEGATAAWLVTQGFPVEQTAATAQSLAYMAAPTGAMRPSRLLNGSEWLSLGSFGLEVL